MAHLRNDALKHVVDKVQSMAYDFDARRIVENEKYSIQNVAWEDCGWKKGLGLGPCISDMSLEVGNQLMPVIRECNFTDTTWNVEIDKISIVVGNEKAHHFANKLETISLKEYLKHFHRYMSVKPKHTGHNGKAERINLLQTDESRDSHAVVSSQACFLPTENGKKTLFNIKLFNYQSWPKNPAVLAIVATSNGTSSQIIEGNCQKLLFNKYGTKANFVGTRITHSHIEMDNFNLNVPLTKQEKRDDCIIIIQVPLKQQAVSMFSQDWVPEFWFGKTEKEISIAYSRGQSSMRKRAMSVTNNEDVNVESPIVKITPRTHPVCKCGKKLQQIQLRSCYGNYGQPVSKMETIVCGECQAMIGGDSDNEKQTAIVWHCEDEKTWQHTNGYDLCVDCAQKQIKFDELNNLGRIIERDERYPIRVTVQYYKLTDNGIIDENIMKTIAQQLKTSRKNGDYGDSLVTQYDSQQPTEWSKRKPIPTLLPMSYESTVDDGKYSFVRKLLNDLGLSQYFVKFKQSEICDSRVILLEERDLESLFDLLGPKVVFRNWMKKYHSH